MSVTDFFRNSNSITIDKKTNINRNLEDLSDRDVKTLEELTMCIYNIRSKTKKERDTIYDNPTLDKFMDELTIMIDEISRQKSIKDYIAHRPGPQMEISVPLEE